MEIKKCSRIVECLRLWKVFRRCPLFRGPLSEILIWTIVRSKGFDTEM